ncbi:MAG: phosphonate metabolism protein/1,5-bisphosphokinase (PRPP-forming) PhnN [Planctomycetota bacterium]
MSGRLFLLLGASGSGKDSLLRYAASQCNDPQRLRVARRAITRAPSKDEHFEPITEHTFNRRAAAGAFALWWTANGCGYGVGRCIDGWLAAGCTVLVNGSRQAFGAARERYPACQGILVDVDEAVLRQRLSDRGRESATAIEQRLQRHRELAVCQLTHLHVDNNGCLQEAGEQLLDLVDPVRSMAVGCG